MQGEGNLEWKLKTPAKGKHVVNGLDRLTDRQTDRDHLGIEFWKKTLKNFKKNITEDISNIRLQIMRQQTEIILGLNTQSIEKGLP